MTQEQKLQKVEAVVPYWEIVDAYDTLNEWAENDTPSVIKALNQCQGFKTTKYKLTLEQLPEEE